MYSYVDLGDDNAPGGTGGDADETIYLVYDSERTVGGTTTYVYRSVDILADAVDADDDGTAEQAQVTADLAAATAYQHINFGVWAALMANGRTISGLGIGFVNTIDGATMTGADMPNNGGATYRGDWVATVQDADPDGDGTVNMRNGAAMLTADFGDNEITVDLVGLADLEGDIDGNTFSGTEATVDDGPGGLTDGADFTGTFNGAFFGAQAAEAGGVFNFASEDNEDGAFAGAFGGDRQPEDN